MTTIRFTHELTDRILKLAAKKMEPAIVKAHETRPDNSWGQYVYDTLLYEVKPILIQLPVGWFYTIKQLEISIHMEWSIHRPMIFELATPQPWPQGFANNELAYRRSTYNFGNDIMLIKHPVWDKFYTEMDAHYRRVQEAVEQRDEVVKVVGEICTKYSTLALALKVWPPLWELIPDDVKNKHQQTVKYENKKPVIDVNTDKLTAIFTTMKLGVQ